MLVIAACSDDSNDATDAATADTGSVTASAPASEEITLKVWDFLDQPDLNEQANDEIDPAYATEHPGITIDRTFVPQEGYWAKLQAAIAAGDGPDIVTMYPGSAARQYANGLLPLDDRLTDEQRADLNFLDQAKTDGVTLALPFTAYAYVMEFNKQLFADAGLDPETAIGTYDGLLDACDAFSAAGVTPIAAGFQDGFYPEWILYVLGSQMFSKADIAAQNNGDVAWTDSRYTTALEKILEMKDRNCFSDGYLTRTGEEGFDEFYRGEAAFYFSVGAQEDKVDLLGKDAIGYTTPPLLSEGAYTEPMTDSLWGAGYSITSWSEHPDEAYEFLSYYVSAPGLNVIGKYTPHQLPSARSATPQADDPLTMKLIEIAQLPDNQSIYVGFSSGEIDNFRRFIGEVMEGRLSIPDFQAQLDAERVAAQ